jgi:F-type H+-transporting ATPase subunit gamma
MFKQPKTLKGLRNRMKSLNAMAAITYTMKLVAAAKVRRAQQAVLRGRPFNEQLEGLIGGLLSRLEGSDIEIPLLEEKEEIKSVALVMIYSDRGLCGPYNNRMRRVSLARIKELEAQGIRVDLFTIGNKGTGYFDRDIIPNKVLASWECGTAPTAEQAKNISEKVLDGFYKGDFDRVELVYTEFINMIDQFPALRTVVPILGDDLSIPEDEVFRLTTKESQLVVEKEAIPVAPPAEFVPDMQFDEDPAQLLNSLLPLYLNGQILRVLQEAVASELAMRMQAMDKACSNAKKMEKSTTLLMHKVRKERINARLAETTIVCEIFKKKAEAEGQKFSR